MICSLSHIIPHSGNQILDVKHQSVSSAGSCVTDNMCAHFTQNVSMSMSPDTHPVQFVEDERFVCGTSCDLLPGIIGYFNVEGRR